MLFRLVFGFFGCVFPYLTEPLMPDLRVFVASSRHAPLSNIHRLPLVRLPLSSAASGVSAWRVASTRQGGFSPWAARAGHALLSRSRGVFTGWLLVVDWLSGPSVHVPPLAMVAFPAATALI